MSDREDYYEYFDDGEGNVCWQCDGDGWGVEGEDWSCDDPINGPYPGEMVRCPCCHGTGKASDCTYW